MTDTVGSIGAHIRAQREAASVSLRQLAATAGVSNPYLSQVERGLRRPSAAVLGQIAGALRVSAESLYVQAGLLQAPDEGEVAAAVTRDPRLTQPQRDALLEVYRAFVARTAAAAATTAPDDPTPDPTDGPTPTDVLEDTHV